MKDTMLLFDLDGTLWDASEQVAQSYNIILRSLDLPNVRHDFTAKDISSLMGRTMDEIGRALFPEMEEKERTRLFSQIMEYEVEYVSAHCGMLYPDTSATLSILREKGYPMAVVSNCQTGYIGAFFTSSGLGSFFCDYEEWGRTGRPKAENIRLVMERNHFEKAVYIGDTAGDQQSAAGAHIPFIHAAYGYGAVTGADTVISRLFELTDLF